MRISGKFIILAVTALIVFGCESENSATSGAKAPRSTPEELDLSVLDDDLVETEVKDPRVIAKVNGEPITMGEVSTMANKVLHNKGLSPYTPEGVKELLEIKPNVFNTLVTLKLLKNGAKHLKIKLEPAVLEKHIEKVKERYPSEKDFLKALEKEGFTLEQYKQTTREEIALQTFKDMIMSEGLEEPSEEEIEEFYQRHKSVFMQPEMIRVQTIVIGYPSDPTIEEKTKAFEEINRLYFRILDGEDFGELAKIHSVGPNAENGGDLGYKPREDIEKYLAGASDKYVLATGSVTPVLETPTGYVLLFPTDIKPAKNISLEQAKPEIVKLMQEKQKAKNLQDWLNKANEKAKIEVVDPELYLTVVTE